MLTLIQTLESKNNLYIILYHKIEKIQNKLFNVTNYDTVMSVNIWVRIFEKLENNLSIKDNDKKYINNIIV